MSLSLFPLSLSYSYAIKVKHVARLHKYISVFGKQSNVQHSGEVDTCRAAAGPARFVNAQECRGLAGAIFKAITMTWR